MNHLSASKVLIFLWLAVPIVFLGTEAIAAMHFSGYSYSINYISDLGADTGVFYHRAMHSPWRMVMNFGFSTTGALLFAAGMVLLATRPCNGWRSAGLMEIIAGTGQLMVGAFHPSTDVAPWMLDMHFVGAVLFIVVGNIAAIASLKELKYRRLGVVLGVAGLLGALILEVQANEHSIILFPDGIWERVAIYPILIWRSMAGISLMKNTSHQASL